ncbi:CAP domain-containing protein [Psychromarinibacter sediminicola]|uniref:CAP domain-containing protein n=1 Tax=Psychromarinibacter sediminicola TaxID=3033385 RepID=UPI002868667E|nr:CAP domain-containing protein [Psychromarinibacter sediminicola]
MMRPILLLLTGMILLAGCGAPAPDGSGGVFRLSNSNQGPVQLRMLDSVNALRRAKGLPAVQLDSALNAAALTHSNDMARQNRPWHFGSNGSSPVERVARAGYQKRMLGENISETYETDTETLAAWMKQAATREVILHPDAEDLGFAYHQESTGKVWYTLVMGGGALEVPISPAPPANTAPPAPDPAPEVETETETETETS